ncbi:MAG TPA: [Fe-Fe] hydrogenase large subunit C-terminal domain-containing protein, partial [Bacillota bacterium]|nr:[Fe-Fe] hydrogenase large subunit C-terminal domain-containing protein [Bacillota bacterium]
MDLIIRTIANCKNCYKCVRTCPVKAVRFADGQAEVVEDRCLGCGECVLACPQKAKKFAMEGFNRFRSWLGRERVIVSLAPSAAGYFGDLDDLYAWLKKNGVEAVRETAEGAELVAHAYRQWLNDHPEQPWVTANCPVVVGLFEKHHPELLKYLAPIVSPIVAHGRLIKKIYGPKVKVVMVGPCPAKSFEVRDPHFADAVDAVVTFDQLAQIYDSQVNIRESYDESVREKNEHLSRLFPLPGGMLPAAEEEMDWESLVLHGMEDLQLLIESLTKGEILPDIVEALGCRQGCLGGFSFRQQGRSLGLTQRFLSMINKWPETDWNPENVNLYREYKNKKWGKTLPTERQIRQVLQESGKYKTSDELNCGACGYSSCREKAIAVCQGMAEVGMCMPYMESKAESLSNQIIEATPHAVVLVDRQMKIREFNPSAELFFGVNRNDILGQSMETVIPVDNFRWVARTREPIFDKKVSYPQ